MESTIKRKQTYELVIEATAAYFNMTSNELLTEKSKTPSSSYKRHLCFYLIRENDPLVTMKFIANLFGFTTHSTVEHGQKKIVKEAEIYRKTKQAIDEIQVLIGIFRAQNQELFNKSICLTPSHN